MSRTISLSFHLNFRSFLLVGVIFSGTIPLPGLSPLSQAQTPPITPSGLKTAVSDPIIGEGTTQYNITGGTRPGAGPNLFHSFGDFNVPTNNIVNFLNGVSFDLNGSPLAAGLPTTNILARVTNPNPSSIFGTIQTTGFGTANLFLMNPAGILFGPNVILNVGGSVTFTTADYLRLADGIRFNAIPNAAADALLSASPVAAFGFLGSNPAAINFEAGQLTVADGTGLSLIGGDINLLPDSSGTPSTITAPGRPIQVTSVAGPGEVVTATGVPEPGMALGTITLDQGTIISTAGDLAFGDGSGGSVSIRGGQFVANAATIVTSPAEASAGSGGAVTFDVAANATFTDSIIQTTSFFAGSAGAVSIKAKDALTIINTAIDTSTIFAVGDSGTVTLITEGPLSLTDSTITTSSDSGGNAGAVSLAGDILLQGTIIGTTAFEGGNAGPVTLTGLPGMTLNGSGIFTDVVGVFGGSSTSRSGAVSLAAETSVMMADSLISATSFETAGDGSAVKITGRSVSLINAGIDTTAQSELVSPAGVSGHIEIRGNDINLTGSMLTSIINNGSPETTGPGGSILFLDAENIGLTASVVNTSSNALGTGGSIEFHTRTLTMADSTVVGSEAFGPGSGGTVKVIGAENVILESGSQVSTTTTSEGPGGNILFETRHLAINNGSLLRSDSFGVGNAGSITVQGKSPTESVLITGAGSGMFTEAHDTGAGGSIFVNSNNVALQNGGTLSAKTSGTETTATGGSITVAAPNQVSMTGDASITASSTGPADAGNIAINAGRQLDMHDSSIKTEAAQASGGNIDIQAIDRVSLVNSTISTSVLGGSGSGGNITIDPVLISLANSSILAQAILGSGGNIRLVAGLLLVDPTSLISASSEFGQSGTIQSPTSNLAGTVGSLPSSVRQGQALQAQRCASLSGESSSFIIAGRDTVPTEPGGWMVSSIASLSAGTGQEARGYGVMARGERSEARGEGKAGTDTGNLAPDLLPLASTPSIENTSIVSLRRLTPAGFLTQHFAEGEISGCRS